MTDARKGLAPNGQSVGMGILSWRGYKSLSNTLQSYQEADLFSLFDEVLVFLPDPDESVIAAAPAQYAHANTLPIRGQPFAGVGHFQCSLIHAVGRTCL